LTDKDTRQKTSLPDQPINIVTDLDSDAIDIASESDGVSISPGEQRKNYRLYVAGGLAAILWLSLLGVIAYHCFSTFYFSRQLSQLKTEEKSSSVKEAIQMSQETAQSIYTFLTPLAAAVTAFFFDANGSSKDDLV
jgi:hypothetical protein